MTKSNNLVKYLWILWVASFLVTNLYLYCRQQYKNNESELIEFIYLNC